jgi:uncharacterized protein YbbK (DUF523 family)
LPQSEQIRVLGVNNHTLDVTDELKSYAQTFLLQYPDILGVIVKSKSPSCGFQSSPLFVTQENEDNTERLYKQIELTSGFFVQALRALKPALKIIEDTELVHENDCINWLNELLLIDNN